MLANTKLELMSHFYRFGLLVFAILAISANVVASSSGTIASRLGLKEGQRYSDAKAHLLKSGWEVDQNYSTPNPKSPYGFKEVICGEGLMAVCSARFLKSNQEIMLTLNSKNELLLDGVWDDK